MPVGTKSVQVGLNVYRVNNNVRGVKLSTSFNVDNVNQDFKEISTVVLASGGTYTYTATAGNKITIVAVAAALLSAAVTLFGGGGFTKNITACLLLDMEVSSIVFTNNDVAVNAELDIISG